MTTTDPEAPARSTTSPSGPASSGLVGPGSAMQRGLAHVRRIRGAGRDALAKPLADYYLLLGAAALLLCIGLIMVLSSSSIYAYKNYDGNSYAVVVKQLMWVAIGVPCAWFASRLPDKWIRRLAYLGFVTTIVLLALVAKWGVEVNGNKNWLALGPVSIQPAEIAKFALVLWAANIYANKERRLHSLHHILVPVVPGMLAVIALVLVGRDLGTSLVLFAIMLGMLWVVGAPPRLFALCLSVIAVLAIALAAVSPTRMARIANFSDPFRDYHFTGWQPAHGLYALASGRWFGEGLGASRQKWGDLPEAHTDFIFAVLGEELGLVGTLLVVGLFLALAFAGIRVAQRTEDPFVRYMSFGIIVWLLGQMVINVGMVLTVLPVIGIPLPLISYGGSALVPSLVAIGLLVGFARKEPAAAAALAARRGRPSSSTAR